MKNLKDVVGVAVFLAISTWSVRKLERQGKLKAVRIGRRVLFEQEELERFIARAKAPGGDQLSREAPAVARVAVPDESDVEGGDRA
jgi:excisionase family DNA binding protein